jgi:hypothetical protein
VVVDVYIPFLSVCSYSLTSTFTLPISGLFSIISNPSWKGFLEGTTTVAVANVDSAFCLTRCSLFTSLLAAT